jgi:hypothetical protein
MYHLINIVLFHPTTYKTKQRNAWTMCRFGVSSFAFSLPTHHAKNMVPWRDATFLWAQLWSWASSNWILSMANFSCVYVLDLDHISMFCTPCNMANKYFGTRNLDLFRIMGGDGDKICTLFLPTVDAGQGPTCRRGEFSPSWTHPKAKDNHIFLSSFSWLWGLYSCILVMENEYNQV